MLLWIATTLVHAIVFTESSAAHKAAQPRSPNSLSFSRTVSCATLFLSKKKKERPFWEKREKPGPRPFFRRTSRSAPDLRMICTSV